jgi:hypothetical protein
MKNIFKTQCIVYITKLVVMYLYKVKQAKPEQLVLQLIDGKKSTVMVIQHIKE